MMNALNRNVEHIRLDNQVTKWVAQRLVNWKYFNLDDIVKDDLDLVVDPNANNISDLYVSPVSFPKMLEEHLTRFAANEEETHEYKKA